VKQSGCSTQKSRITLPTTATAVSVKSTTRRCLPALVRLSLESVDGAFYFAQFLFHLEGDGSANAFFTACDDAQRAFILDFVEHMILSYPEKLESNGCANHAFRVQAIWSAVR
jgi:hypothetical protein